MERKESFPKIDENEVMLKTLNNIQQQIDMMKAIVSHTHRTDDQGLQAFSMAALGNLSDHYELSHLNKMQKGELVNLLASKIAENSNQKIQNNIQTEVEKKKHKLSVDIIPNKMEIFRIVFTGGPCAGKTTAITKVAEQLREKGYTVFTVPEAATMIFQSGGQLNFDKFNDEMIKKFQYYLLMLQMTIEDALQGIACNSGGRNIVLLCDRGTMDGRAYMSKKNWEELLSENDLSMHKIRDARYDLIVHISSAANGAEDFYNLSNNKARSEHLDLARDLDKKLEEAWIDHPNFVQINNNFGSFEEKINSIIMTVFKFLTIPVSINFYKKYLVANPDEKLVTILENCDEIKVHKFSITDIIFYKDDNNTELSYFRKRVNLLESPRRHDLHQVRQNRKRGAYS
jgi:thymidylate kinase